MLILNSPAKINLFLKIMGKRPDGYHDLCSLFQTLDLTDTLKLNLSDSDNFTCTDHLIQSQDNLALKALCLFRDETKLNFSVHCHLIKNIPLQAGLGGGSSNAATMLKGLNQLLNFPLDDLALHLLAAKLGSDVPFFLKGGSAFCEGRGELVKTLRPLERQTVWIVKPPIGISTPEVYRNLDLSKLPLRNPKESLQAHLFGKGEYYNDLEETALAIEPSVKELKKHLLKQGFRTVMLSGSGSSLICFGEGEPNVPADTFSRRCTFI